MTVRLRCVILALVCCWVAGGAFAQDAPPPVEKIPVDKSAPTPKINTTEPPRQDAEDVLAGESSSKQTQVDVSAPKNDEKDHPHSAEVDSDPDLMEFHPYDPHKAMKAVEVGDFYFKKENYRAAISRYQEALQWKPNDAEATYKLAQAFEKCGNTAGAVENYQSYLKILPHGPYAAPSQKALDRLKANPSSANATQNPG
jgi:tetratricopeptide (TPR) repeat protein